MRLSPSATLVPAVLVTADPVVVELEGAVVLRRSGAEPRTLRRLITASLLHGGRDAQQIA